MYNASFERIHLWLALNKLTNYVNVYHFGLLFGKIQWSFGNVFFYKFNMNVGSYISVNFLINYLDCYGGWTFKRIFTVSYISCSLFFRVKYRAPLEHRCTTVIIYVCEGNTSAVKSSLKTFCSRVTHTSHSSSCLRLLGTGLTQPLRCFCQYCTANIYKQIKQFERELDAFYTVHLFITNLAD